MRTRASGHYLNTRHANTTLNARAVWACVSMLQLHVPRPARCACVLCDAGTLKIVFVLTVLKQCIIHTATASSRGRRSGSASGEMPPVPMAVIQPTSAADPGVQQVGDDDGVRSRGFEAAAVRLPEKRPALELADHMFDRPAASPS